MKNIYEVFVYLDGELFVNLENIPIMIISNYQELANATHTIMKMSQHTVAQVYLKRNGYNIAEIHFHKYLSGLVTYCTRYKKDFLPCDPLCEVVKKWEQ